MNSDNDLSKADGFSKAELAAMRERYAADGFIRIDALGQAADIAAVRSLLDPLFDVPEFAGQLEIHEAVKRAPALTATRIYARCHAIARALLGVPTGYIFDHAIYKPPYHGHATPWHQDEIYNQAPMLQRAVNFSIPLQAATVDNGCLWYWVGSHRAGVLAHRAADAPIGTLGSLADSTATRDPSFALERVEESHTVASEFPLGGATAHHPLCAHSAGRNNTDEWRKVWVLHFGAYGKWRYKLHPRALAAKLHLIPRR